MHGSIWLFRGDADDLATRFDAMLATVGTAHVTALLVLRTADGLVLVDTCPTFDAYAAFYFGAGFEELLAAHGLPKPQHLHDAPIHALITEGQVRARVPVG